MTSYTYISPILLGFALPSLWRRKKKVLISFSQKVSICVPFLYRFVSIELSFHDLISRNEKCPFSKNSFPFPLILFTTHTAEISNKKKLCTINDMICFVTKKKTKKIQMWARFPLEQLYTTLVPHYVIWCYVFRHISSFVFHINDKKKKEKHFFFKRNSVCLCDCLNLQSVEFVCAVCVLAARIILSFRSTKVIYAKKKKKMLFWYYWWRCYGTYIITSFSSPYVCVVPTSHYILKTSTKPPKKASQYCTL